MDIIKNNFSDVNFNTNLFLHFLILYTFLTIFFMTFIAKVSTQAFNHEVTHLINEGLRDKFNNIKKNLNMDLIKKILPVDKVKKLLEKEDKAVEAHNKGLINLTIVTALLLWVSFATVVYILINNCNSKLEIGTIFLENLIIFSFVGIGEYFFFTRVATKFVPVEPSFISKKFFEGIKNKLN
jgi:hypothetical protein